MSKIGRHARDDVLLDASAVFDRQRPMEQGADAFRAMRERQSIKTLVWP